MCSFVLRVSRINIKTFNDFKHRKKVYIIETRFAIAKYIYKLDFAN